MKVMTIDEGLRGDVAARIARLLVAETTSSGGGGGGGGVSPRDRGFCGSLKARGTELVAPLSAVRAAQLSVSRGEAPPPPRPPHCRHASQPVCRDANTGSRGAQETP